VHKRVIISQYLTKRRQPHLRFFVSETMRFLVVLSLALILVSCAENDMEQVAAITDDTEQPIVVMKNARIEFTDSALLKAVIAAGIVETYQYFDDEGKPEDQKLVMTDGVRADFYNKFEQINSTMTSERATRFEKERLTEIEGNVVVVNVDGDSLSSEFLLWDEGNNTISSDRHVRVKTADEIIFAEGFESDANFQEYSFTNVKGRINLKK